jgi:hypothetical protein
MATATQATLADFLPTVPRTPPAAVRRRNTTTAKAAQSAPGVTATVTRRQRTRVSSPPTAPASSAPPEESKRQKFLRLGGGRMVNVLRSIRLLGNLANRGIYDWTEQDVATMRQAIDAQLDASFGKFERGQVVRLENEFRFVD